MSRKCARCGVEKPLSDFYRSNNVASGYQSRCKRCDGAGAASRWLLSLASTQPTQGGGCTLEEVAVALGVSRSRAAQIERSALSKLRRLAERRGVRP